MSSKHGAVPSLKTILLVLLALTTITAFDAMGQDDKAVPATEQDQKNVSKKSEEEVSHSSGIELKSEKNKQSYALGMNMGKQVKGRGVEVDVDTILQGLKDSLAGDKTLLSDEEASTEVRELQQEVKRRSIALRRETLHKNKKDGEAFLAANKAKDGVLTLASGLQYRIVKAGEGKKPSGNDIIFCNYRGTLIDGTEFDSSYRRGKPSAFAFSRVMKGWKEALELMPAGSRWEIFVPSELAYGATGAGTLIGPNSTLIFDLELVSIRSRVNNTQEPQTEIASGLESGIVQQKASEPVPVDSAIPVSDLRISFKLDPRLSGPTYGGERWIASSPFTSLAQVGTQASVDAKADGVAKNGAPLRTAVQWTPSDPEMITVAAAEDTQVKITVHHAGESKLIVASNGISKELRVKAKYVGNATQIEISQ